MESTPAKATFDIQFPSGSHPYSGHSMRNNLLGIYEGDLQPMRPLAHDVPDMRVMILGADAQGYFKGIYYGDCSQRIPVASGDTAAMSAPASDPRIDVVYLKTDGTIGVETGVEATNPTIPVISASGDRIPVCAVYHRVGTQRIVNYADKDTYTGDSYIYQDLRPLYVLPVEESASLEAEQIRNSRNSMLNVMKLAQIENLARNRFIDGWCDELVDGTGIVPSTEISGDLVTTNDKKRFSRNYTYDTALQRIVRNVGQNVGADGKYVIVAGKAPFDWLATKADLVVITGSGDLINCEISRNSGDDWTDIPLTNEFYDGIYYYKSGRTTDVSGDYTPAGSGDYYLTFVVPSGANTTIEGYAVTLA